MVTAYIGGFLRVWHQKRGRLLARVQNMILTGEGIVFNDKVLAWALVAIPNAMFEIQRCEYNGHEYSY